MAGLFSKIVSGEIPCHKIAENDNYLAFLDIMPLANGHTLVIPKLEIDYLFDLDDNLLAGMLVFAKPIAKAIKSAIPCKRIGVAAIGLEVPHAHIHLVPLHTVDDLNFTKPKLSPSTEQLAAVALAIRQYLIESGSQGSAAQQRFRSN